MKVFFTAAARSESLEAFDFYQQRSEQAAQNFLRCLETACEMAGGSSNDWQAAYQPEPGVT